MESRVAPNLQQDAIKQTHQSCYFGNWCFKMLG